MLMPGRYPITVLEGSRFVIPGIGIYDMSPYGGPSRLDADGVDVEASVLYGPPGSPTRVEMNVEVLDPATRVVTVSLPGPRASWGGSQASWELVVTWPEDRLKVLGGPVTLVREG